MKRGTYVNRSTYQKLAEENKKLKADLRTLVILKAGGSKNFMEVYEKWSQYFRKQKHSTESIREIIMESLKGNPIDLTKKN